MGFSQLVRVGELPVLERKGWERELFCISTLRVASRPSWLAGKGEELRIKKTHLLTTKTFVIVCINGDPYKHPLLILRPSFSWYSNVNVGFIIQNPRFATLGA